MSGMNMDRFHRKYDEVAANSGLEFADVPRVTVSNGTIVRLIGDFECIWEHFITTDKGQRPYYCGGPETDCPACQAVAKLSYESDGSKQELATASKAKEKFYFNCLDRSPAGRVWHQQNKKTQLLSQNQKGASIGSMLFQSIANIAKMRKQQGQPEDPNTYDVMLQKTGSGMQTKYSAQFTGAVEPLTAEELAYEQFPLSQIAKQSTRSDLEAAAAFLIGQQPQQQQTDPSKFQAAGPVQQAKQQVQSRPASAPPPATQPVKQAMKLQAKSEYQDTRPRDVDMKDYMLVPCSNCNAEMLIGMNDQRDLKCHSCQTVYTHPNKV